MKVTRRQLKKIIKESLPSSDDILKVAKDLESITNLIPSEDEEQQLLMAAFMYPYANPEIEDLDRGMRVGGMLFDPDSPEIFDENDLHTINKLLEEYGELLENDPLGLSEYPDVEAKLIDIIDTIEERYENSVSFYNNQAADEEEELERRRLAKLKGRNRYYVTAQPRRANATNPESGMADTEWWFTLEDRKTGRTKTFSTYESNPKFPSFPEIKLIMILPISQEDGMKQYSNLIAIEDISEKELAIQGDLSYRLLRKPLYERSTR